MQMTSGASCNRASEHPESDSWKAVTKYLEEGLETYSQPRKEPYCQRVCNPKFLIPWLLHWEGTEQAHLCPSSIRSHGRSFKVLD